MREDWRMCSYDANKSQHLQICNNLVTLFPCEILGQASHQTNETLLNRGVLRSALSKIA